MGVLVAGEGPEEDLAKGGGGGRPVVAMRESFARGAPGAGGAGGGAGHRGRAALGAGRGGCSVRCGVLCARG